MSITKIIYLKIHGMGKKDDDDDERGWVNMIYVHEMTEDEAMLAIVQY